MAVECLEDGKSTIKAVFFMGGTLVGAFDDMINVIGWIGDW